METLKKIASNQYFPAAAVLTAVLLFWTIAMFGGLSLLHNNQPPMATLTWMLFVYGAAVLTPLAGIVAAVDLVRRWRRNRECAPAGMTPAEVTQDEYAAAEAAQEEQFTNERASDQQPAQEAGTQSVPTQPVQYRPAAQHQPAKKQPGQTNERRTAA
ncbi:MULTISPECIES: hypothetical protein [unclassified Arthrobacter]|uniref:hypothetical protein n=1 Tax=unclassified Arthrobacter TaxID=235627 RepID=UPI003393B70D